MNSSSSPPREGIADPRRSARYPFVAQAEIGELGPDTRVYGRVTEISTNGCYMDSAHNLPVGQHVFVKIFTASDFFESAATVIYGQPNLGMGLEFQGIHRHFRPTLQRWLLEAMRVAGLQQT